MAFIKILPFLAFGGFILFAVIHAYRDDATQNAGWLFPAGLSVAFLAWSISAVLIEGPFGFWTEHTRNLWGNQISFDLLLAVGIGWFLIVPQAKRLGMHLYLWLLLIVCTGSIGFLAMVSRLLFLRARYADTTG